MLRLIKELMRPATAIDADTVRQQIRAKLAQKNAIRLAQIPVKA